MSQNLVSIVNVGPLEADESVTLAHGLFDWRGGLEPSQVICDRASSIAVVSVNETSITFTNLGASPASARFRVEHDHSIHAEGASALAWQGLVTTVGPQGPQGEAGPQGDEGPQGPPGPSGGSFAPVYGAFSDTSTQNIPTGAGAAASFDTDDLLGGVTAVANGAGKRTRLTVPTTGIYAFDISPQMDHSGGGTETITFWAKVNGLNVPRSASSFEMGNNNNRSLPFLQLDLPMTAGQYLEWWFASTGGTNIALHASPAAGPYPAIPSVIATVKRIA